MSQIKSAVLLAISSVCWMRTGIAAPIDIDPSFGNSGYVSVAAKYFVSQTRALAVDSLNQIYALGSNDYGLSLLGTGYTPPVYEIRRLTANGAADSSVDILSAQPPYSDVPPPPDSSVKNFGGDGNIYHAMTVDESNHRLVLAGNSGNSLVLTTVYYEGPHAGYSDLGFGDNGYATLPALGVSDGLAVQLQSDGQILVSGVQQDSNSQTKSFVARFHSSGLPDQGFNGNGFVMVNLGGDSNSADALLADSNHRVLVCGSALTLSSTVSEIAVARLLSSGTADGNFGTNGVATSAFDTQLYCSSLFQQIDNKTVIASSSPNSTYVAIGRVTTTGQLDSSFGTDGFSDGDLPQGLSWSGISNFQSSGKLLVAVSGNREQMSLVRLEGASKFLPVVAPANGSTSSGGGAITVWTLICFFVFAGLQMLGCFRVDL